MEIWVVNLVITAPDTRTEPLLLTVLLVALSLFAVVAFAVTGAVAVSVGFLGSF